MFEFLSNQLLNEEVDFPTRPASTETVEYDLVVQQEFENSFQF